MLWRNLMLAVPTVEMLPTQVLDRVGRIARGLQADVELFACVYDPAAVQPGRHAQAVDAVITSNVEDLHRRLERLADTLRGQGVRVHCSVRWDHPMYEAVVRHAARHNVDLLITPARGFGDIGPRTLHYREARLIETCPCPLLLLKTPQVYSEGCVVGAVDPLHAYEFPQELDEQIVGAAKMMSYALANAPIRLYHADANSANGGAQEGAGDRKELLLKQVRDIAERHNIELENVDIESGAVERSLPAFTRAAHADVLVIGAFSRRYRERPLLGHTAEQILDAVDCDVLVVKPAGFVASVDREPAPAVPVPA